jgi:hypothetical protein
MAHEDVHADLGAYALGVLDGRGQRRFEAHLGRCASCASELEQLFAIPGLVDERVSELDAGSAATTAARDQDEAGMRDLLGRLQNRNRRSARRLKLAGAAAAIVLVAGTATATGLLTGNSPRTPPSPSSSGTSVTHLTSASNPATGVSASLAAGQRPWGYLLELTIRDSQGPRHCRLTILTKAGQLQNLAAWQVPVKNYPGQVVVYADTDMKLANIAVFRIYSTDGGYLLTMPNPRSVS